MSPDFSPGFVDGRWTNRALQCPELPVARAQTSYDGPMYYHIWFGTKYRRRVLVGEIGAFVEGALSQIAATRNLDLAERRCYVDHAHLLLELPDRSSLPKGVQLLKGGSAYRTF